MLFRIPGLVKKISPPIAAVAASVAGVSGGRLSLATQTSVMTSTQAAKTTVFWVPHHHVYAPLYNGASVVHTSMGGELNQATTDATKSPAAVAASKNYDMFLWDDSGVKRCTRGPTWDAGAVAGSDLVRGTGAGSTELARVQGLLVNSNAITNGPAAQRGTYVGTIRSNASSQIDFIYGGIASGGTAAAFNLWNMYNRVDVTTLVGDSDNSWSYASTTIRSSNGSNNRRISFVSGFQEDGFSFITYGFNVGGTSNAACVGIGIDVTNAFTGAIGEGSTTAIGPAFGLHSASFLGAHFAQDCESVSSGAATCTFYGDAGAPTLLQTGMTGRLRM